MEARGFAVLVLATLLALSGAAPTGQAETEGQPLVVFGDQRTTGDMVIVDAARMPEGGFVAVHDPQDGSLGPILGNSVLLGAGLHQDIPVLLSDNVTEPRSLIAVLYQDGNDNTVFDQADGHDHDHGDDDPPYRDGDAPIGDHAEVEPYDTEPRESSGPNPLIAGAIAAAFALVLWAARFR